VLPAWRGKGIGRVVMRALIDEAARRGHAEVALNSQVSAVPFYLTLGFDAYGEEFVEAGIPHQAMKRHLG
jgi:predicted GNAT family N-acyltransferase